MDKEELILKNRFLDLARNSYFKNIVTHSVFLNLYEQTIFEMVQKELPDIKYSMFGGYDEAERKIVCFYCENNIEYDMFDFIRIEPVNSRFADELSHRDFLGALMNLGIERHMIGDICIENNTAHVITFKSISDAIIDNMDMVKHTKVYVERESGEAVKSVNRLKLKSINISSERLDSVIGAIFNISRSKVNLYLDAGKVFINSKQSFSHSSKVSTGDIITVRGLGRSRFLGIKSTSKKGRLFGKVEIFT